MRNLLYLALAVLTSCAHNSVDVLQAGHIAHIEQHLVAPSYAPAVPADHASIADRLAYYHVPAVSIAVIHNGRLAWSRAYGTADLATAQAADEHTLFHGASLSKTVNAVTVMKFVHDGKLDLDKDVNDQLTGWKLPPSELAKGKPTTLRQLLSHTAGMSVRYLGTGFPETGPVPTLVDFLNGKPPATQPVKVVDVPGRQFYYSGGAIAISQLMLEEAAHEPYPVLIDQTVFMPLGMTESTFELQLRNEWRPRAAPGYKDGKRVNGADRVYPAMAAAGLWTTPGDFTKVVIEIQRAAGGHGPKVLGSEVKEMLRTYIANAKSANPRPASVGLGVFLTGEGANQQFYHAGSHAGYACYAMGFLAHDDGIVVMTNGDDAFDLIAEVAQTVGREYGWEAYDFMPPPRAPKPTTAPKP